jgi:hypothetical protein
MPAMSHTCSPAHLTHLYISLLRSHGLDTDADEYVPDVKHASDLHSDADRLNATPLRQAPPSATHMGNVAPHQADYTDSGSETYSESGTYTGTGTDDSRTTGTDRSYTSGTESGSYTASDTHTDGSYTDTTPKRSSTIRSTVSQSPYIVSARTEDFRSMFAVCFVVV